LILERNNNAHDAHTYIYINQHQLLRHINAIALVAYLLHQQFLQRFRNWPDCRLPIDACSMQLATCHMPLFAEHKSKAEIGKRNEMVTTHLYATR